jgi:3-phosphoshikimate 1-carboxyvinyltransferase
MSLLEITRARAFEVEIPDIAPDKSISHRCAIFSLLCAKPSKVRNYLRAEDTLNTLEIIKALGAKVDEADGAYLITPPAALTEPAQILDCGNSGTAMRLMMGFLSSVDGFFVLHGDKYLATRPMRRVADPLRKIGAHIDGRSGGNLSPISVRGAKPKAFDYTSPIASAQVKSALILAALRADGISTFGEPELSRDHTERMLKGMGAQLETEGNLIRIHPLQAPLSPLNITVPADPSSAFFFAVAAAIIPGAKVTLKNVLLNKTRVEAYNILAKMGARVEFRETSSKYESIGDIIVSHAPLKAVEVSQNISWLIDELPALSIAFACAEGKSVVKNAAELRVKESDRIATVVNNLREGGIEASETEDGYEVVGGHFREATYQSWGDHRIAMSFTLACLAGGGNVEEFDCVNPSFPNFVELINLITEAKLCR